MGFISYCVFFKSLDQNYYWIKNTGTHYCFILFTLTHQYSDQQRTHIITSNCALWAIARPICVNWPTRDATTPTHTFLSAVAACRATTTLSSSVRLWLVVAVTTRYTFCYIIGFVVCEEAEVVRLLSIDACLTCHVCVCVFLWSCDVPTTLLIRIFK